MRLWPRSRTRAQIQQHKQAADKAASESKRSLRRVEARGPAVDHMVGLLKFYSDRNGFADAFEEMLAPRGSDGHEVRG